MPEHLPDDIQAALREVADRYRVIVEDARVLHHHSNTVIALPSARLLMRIAGNPDALTSVTSSVQVTRWLGGRGYPCVTPASGEPFTVNGHVVSVWQLLDTAEGPLGSGSELGQLLRALHEQPNPPFRVPELVDPFASVIRAIETTVDGLAKADQEWLLRRITELRQAWANLSPTRPFGLIHGDAHSNNMIRRQNGGVVLGDWDHTAHGFREWDLVQPFYMHRRFHRHSEQDIANFISEYGYDVRDWHGFEILVEAREISGLSPYIRKASSESWAQKEVVHRLVTLQQRDTAALWNPPPRS